MHGSLRKNEPERSLPLPLDATLSRAGTAEGKAAALDATLTELRKQNEQQSSRAEEDLRSLRERFAGEHESRVRAETERKEVLDRLEEEKQLLAEAREKLTDAFKALAGDALSSSNEQFLNLARGAFEKILAEAKGDLGKKQEAINGLVRPLSESLKQFEEHVRQLEKSRQAAYTSVEEQLKTSFLNPAATSKRNEKPGHGAADSAHQGPMGRDHSPQSRRAGRHVRAL